jgi:hypothetical protein
MKRLMLTAALAALLVPAAAFAAKPPSPKPPKPAAAAKPPKPSSVKPVKHTSHVKPAKPATKAPKAVKPAKTTKAAKTTKPAKSADTAVARSTKDGGAPAGPTTTLTPVQQKLQKNTKLAAKLEARLPAGTDLMRASKGFKNLGQFVAAVNVSNNLGIPFQRLKRKMVTEGMSLGQAIQTLRPGTSGTLEATRAETDARVMIADADASTTTSTSTTKVKVKAKAQVKTS